MSVHEHDCTDLQCNSAFKYWHKSHLSNAFRTNSLQPTDIVFKNLLNELYVIKTLSLFIDKDVTFVSANSCECCFDGIFVISHTTPRGGERKMAVNFSKVKQGVEEDMEGSRFDSCSIIEVISEVSKSFTTARWVGKMSDYMNVLNKRR